MPQVERLIGALNEVYSNFPQEEWSPTLRSIISRERVTPLSEALIKHAVQVDPLGKSLHIWKQHLCTAFGGGEPTLDRGLRMALVALDFRMSQNPHDYLKLALDERTLLQRYFRELRGQ